MANTGDSLVIGYLASMASLFEPLNGAIDEVRVSSTARSSDWIATSFNNQDDPATYESIGGETDQDSVVALNIDNDFINNAGMLDVNGQVVVTTGNFTIGTAGQVVGSGLNGSDITVGGDFTVTGEDGDLLDLVAGALWTLNVAGTATAEYVNVAYSDASGGSEVNASNNSTDGDDNLNWLFVIASTSSSAAIVWEWPPIVGSYKKSQGVLAGGESAQSLELDDGPEIILPDNFVQTKGLPAPKDQAGADLDNEYAPDEYKSGQSSEGGTGADRSYDMFRIDYEEGRKKYRQRYARGKYRTVVIVFEGRVVAAPYNDEGPEFDKGHLLDAGQKAVQEGVILR